MKTRLASSGCIFSRLHRMRNGSQRLTLKASTSHFEVFDGILQRLQRYILKALTAHFEVFDGTL
jgi:hypothetical protein